jgi:hypothetical protein
LAILKFLTKNDARLSQIPFYFFGGHAYAAHTARLARLPAQADTTRISKLALFARAYAAHTARVARLSA